MNLIVYLCLILSCQMGEVLCLLGKSKNKTNGTSQFKKKFVEGLKKFFEGSSSYEDYYYDSPDQRGPQTDTCNRACPACGYSGPGVPANPNFPPAAVPQAIPVPVSVPYMPYAPYPHGNELPGIPPNHVMPPCMHNNTTHYPMPNGYPYYPAPQCPPQYFAPQEPPPPYTPYQNPPPYAPGYCPSQYSSGKSNIPNSISPCLPPKNSPSSLQSKPHSPNDIPLPLKPHSY